MPTLDKCPSRPMELEKTKTREALNMPVLLAWIICWRRFIASCRMWNFSIKKNLFFFLPLTVLMMHFVCYMITLYNAGLIVWWNVYFSLLSLRWSFLDYFLNLFEISTLTSVSGGLKKKKIKKKWLTSYWPKDRVLQSDHSKPPH